MKALINPLHDNVVVQVEQNQFEVAEPLFWVDCPDNVIAYQYSYNGSTFNSWTKPITAEQQAIIDAKQSALNKLMALGLTEEEALALGK